jgi:hypothetical protein
MCLVRRADNLTTSICRVSRYSARIDLLQPVQACTGMALRLPLQPRILQQLSSYVCLESHLNPCVLRRYITSRLGRPIKFVWQLKKKFSQQHYAKIFLILHNVCIHNDCCYIRVVTARSDALNQRVTYFSEAHTNLRTLACLANAVKRVYSQCNPLRTEGLPVYDTFAFHTATSF